MEERKTYQPPLMTVSHVEVEEQLLGVSFTQILPVENGVDALGHDIGGEYEFTVGSDADGNQVGIGANNGEWGISWGSGSNETN